MYSSNVSRARAPFIRRTTSHMWSKGELSLREVITQWLDEIQGTSYHATTRGDCLVPGDNQEMAWMVVGGV